MTSHQKLEQAVQEGLAMLSPSLQILARPALAKLELPADPAELDAKLEHAARLLLQCRSDDAPAAAVVLHIPDPPSVHELAAGE